MLLPNLEILVMADNNKDTLVANMLFPILPTFFPNLKLVEIGEKINNILILLNVV